LGILENAYHETAKLAGVAVDGFFDREKELLDEARGLMGRLPLLEIDVLFCDRLGKNVSGAGLDTNITGRSVYGYVAGQAWCEGMPGINRIIVSDLADESDGNGIGMGHCEFTTERFMKKVNHRITALNGMTACAPTGARTPVVMKNDREMLEAAMRTSRIREEGSHVIYIRDTLELEDIHVSEGCLELCRAQDHIEVVSEPQDLPFDDDGYVISPYRAH
ncbi:MAG: hypothetical protein AAF517_10800, partial [Planctomycetota bacterium]